MSCKPFFDEFLFNLSKVTPFHLSPNTLYSSHTECFQFSQTCHLTSSCWETLLLLTLPAYSKSFHVSAQILLPSRSLSRLGECPALFPHILTFLFWWLPAFWPVCYTRAVSSLRVRELSFHHYWLTAYPGLWPALPLPCSVTLSKLLIALPLYLSSSFVKWI